MARRYSAHESEAVVVGAAKVNNFEEMYLVDTQDRRSMPQSAATKKVLQMWVYSSS